MNIFWCFIFLLSLQLTLANAVFGKMYEYTANSKVTLTIPLSASLMNRISIKNDRILKIVGDLDGYQIESDPVLGCVFISTKFASGISSYASIVTESGLLQDIELQVTPATEPSIITIKQNTMGSAKRPILKEKPLLKDGVISAIKDIALDRTRDYVFRVLEVDDLKLLQEKYNISKVVEYSNKVLRLQKVEFLSLDERANINLEAIAELYPSVLGVAHIRNAIYLVFRL